MHPIHDVDVLLLLALALSSKRRPAELVEIVAAADVIQGVIPSELRLVDAFSRLATHGLICEQDGGFTLTPQAQKVMAGSGREADTEKRIARIKEAEKHPDENDLRAAQAAFAQMIDRLADRGTPCAP